MTEHICSGVHDPRIVASLFKTGNSKPSRCLVYTLVLLKSLACFQSVSSRYSFNLLILSCRVPRCRFDAYNLVVFGTCRVDGMGSSSLVVLRSLCVAVDDDDDDDDRADGGE
jgi:hypothetical protein